MCRRVYMHVQYSVVGRVAAWMLFCSHVKKFITANGSGENRTCVYREPSSVNLDPLSTNRTLDKRQYTYIDVLVAARRVALLGRAVGYRTATVLYGRARRAARCAAVRRRPRVAGRTATGGL